MKLNILILSMVTIMFCLSGCVEVSVVSDSDYEMYSRKDTEIMHSSDNFGYGRSDDVYVALSYVYEDESISKSYGNEFEITPEDIVCYKSEGETSGIKSNFKGEADYSFAISDVRYRIKLSKEYKEKWEVVSCELEVDE